MQHEGGLAGAVGAEQRDPFPLVHMEIDAKQRLVAVGVGVGQAPHVENRVLTVTAVSQGGQGRRGMPACRHCAAVAVKVRRRHTAG